MLCDNQLNPIFPLFAGLAVTLASCKDQHAVAEPPCTSAFDRPVTPIPHAAEPLN